jgi:uncharacterized DUF497 family protein
MKVVALDWDATNRRHFNEHGRCGRQEVEEVLFARCYPTRAAELDREVDAEPRFLFHGRTCSGRHLAVVATPRPRYVLRPITCWPLSPRATTSYEAWRKTVRR